MVTLNRAKVVWLRLFHQFEGRIGGSVGVNAKLMLDAFPSSKVAVLDLSPYFLAAAKMFLESPTSPMYHDEAISRVSYHHGFAECLPFENDSMDIVTIPFVIHELPTPIAERVIREAARVLRPGGVLSILELDGKTIESLPQLRRFLFEITEPHVGDYVGKTNITSMMTDAGFEKISCEKNDPMNSRWMGMKPAPFTSIGLI